MGSPKNAVFYQKRECDYTCGDGKMAMETMKMRRDCEGHLIEMDLNKHAHSIQTYRKRVRTRAHREHGSTGAFVLELFRVQLNKANTGHTICVQTDSAAVSPSCGYLFLIADGGAFHPCFIVPN